MTNEKFIFHTLKLKLLSGVFFGLSQCQRYIVRMGLNHVLPFARPFAFGCLAIGTPLKL